MRSRIRFECVRRNALKWVFPMQIGLEFGKHAQQVEKALAGRGARVDRLFGRFQRRAFFTKLRNDVLQVAIDLASRSTRVTVSVSPARMKSRIVRSSTRPLVDVPHLLAADDFTACTFGRPTIPADEAAAIVADLRAGVGVVKLAKFHGVGVWTVQKLKTKLAA
jgi:hypothetical protein